MASVKLNQGMRDDIVNAMISHKYAPLEKELHEEEWVLARTVYDLNFSKADRKLMESLPEGWLPEDYYMDVRLPGYCSVNLHFADQCHKKADDRIFKRFTNKNGYSIYPEAGSEIIELTQAHYDKKSDLNSEKNSTRKQAMALLKSVTTMNRAIEVWPAAEKFIKEAVGVAGQYQKSNAPLPVVMVEQLNEKLGLPPQEAA